MLKLKILSVIAEIVKMIVNAETGVITDETASMCFQKMQTEMLAKLCDSMLAIESKLDTLIVSSLTKGKS